MGIEKPRTAICWYVYILLNAILMCFCGFYCYKWTDDASELTSYSTAFMNQVALDWNSNMIGDIAVTTDTYCPDDHPEIVYSRRFYGSGIACDCLGIYSEWITGENEMNLGDECSYNQTYYGCIQAKPI